MSDKQFIQDLELGKSISSLFSVKYKHPLKSYKNNTCFMFTIGLADRTGEIEVKYWGGENEDKVKEVYNNFKADDVVHISGKVSEFKDKLEIHINEEIGKIRKSLEYCIEDFIPVTKENIESMMAKLKEVINNINNKHLKILLESFFSDKEFLENFKKAPAAMYIHHAYIGGLLEHTTHMIELCKSIANLYPNLDRDLLLTGVILHDIGKLKEFKVTTNIKQTEEGMLRGHVTLGEEMVLEKIKQISDFPETLKIKIAHIMLSHHGNNEYGSPKEPCFPEAVAVYYADEFDSKIDQYVKIKEEVSTEDFRTYSKRLGSIYLK